MKKLSLLALLCASVFAFGAAAFAADQAALPTLGQPALLTPFGQSQDANAVKLMAKKYQVDYEMAVFAKDVDWSKYKTLIVVLGGSGMSGPDLIKFFVNRIWTWSFMLLSDDRKKGVASMDEVLSKEKIDFMAYHPDGIMFGERTGSIYLIKTIVTFDMLYSDQEEMMSDLFDVYYNSLANTYPEKIVEYVLALENDYDRRPRDI